MDTKIIKSEYDEERVIEDRIIRRRVERRRAERKRIRRNRITAIILLLLLLIIPIHSLHMNSAGDTSRNNKAVTTKSSENVDTNSSETDTDDLTELNDRINTAIGSFNGVWSVYVKNLDTGYSIEIDDHQVYAASEIKLFALSAAYQQVADGLISETDVYNTLYEMITKSSNEAFNSIVWTLGKYYISNWCAENGYNNTIQCHGLYPAYNADGLATSNGYNLTSVKDIGLLLESIYNGSCISKNYSDKMIDMLLEQEYRSKIPAGIPDNIMVANKTGETDDVSHDAAIVYSDKADYILVVMVEAPGTAWSCGDNIAKLSGIVYEYFNK